MTPQALWKRNPYVAILLTIIVFSIVGILLFPETAHAQTGLGGGIYGGPIRSIRNGTADPSTCVPTVDNVFFNTTTGLLKLCTATNTLSPIPTTGAATTYSYAALTAGTMNFTNSAQLGSFVSRFDWTNAMITALGAVLAGDVTVCTLPVGTVVENVIVVIDTPDTSANALTVAVGRVAASYIDYIVASDAKAAANTVYGDASAERGTNNTGWDLPSITATIAIKAHFIKTTSNLNTVTGSTGHVYVVYTDLP